MATTLQRHAAAKWLGIALIAVARAVLPFARAWPAPLVRVQVNGQSVLAAVDPAASELLLDPSTARRCRAQAVAGERSVPWCGSRVAAHAAHHAHPCTLARAGDGLIGAFSAGIGHEPVRLQRFPRIRSAGDTNHEIHVEAAEDNHLGSGGQAGHGFRIGVVRLAAHGCLLRFHLVQLRHTATEVLVG